MRASLRHATGIPLPSRLPIAIGSMEVVGNRNAAQKHARRAEIVLLTANGLGTMGDHAADGKVEDLRLALAGAIRGRGLRGTPARQDAPIAHTSGPPDALV